MACLSKHLFDIFDEDSLSTWSFVLVLNHLSSSNTKLWLPLNYNDDWKNLIWFLFVITIWLYKVLSNSTVQLNESCWLHRYSSMYFFSDGCLCAKVSLTLFSLLFIHSCGVVCLTRMQFHPESYCQLKCLPRYIFFLHPFNIVIKNSMQNSHFS